MKDERRRRYLTSKNFMKVVVFFLIFVPGTIPAIVLLLATIALFTIDPKGYLLQHFIVEFNNYIRSDHTLEIQTAIVVFIIGMTLIFLILGVFDFLNKK